MAASALVKTILLPPRLPLKFHKSRGCAFALKSKTAHWGNGTKVGCLKPTVVNPTPDLKHSCAFPCQSRPHAWSALVCQRNSGHHTTFVGPTSGPPPLNGIG